jgi:hypothetical protein
MRTKFPFPVFVIVLASVSIACSLSSLPGFRTLATGSTRMFTLHEPLPGTGRVQDVSLSMAMGDITLSGGAESLLEGEVRFNVEEWEPILSSQDNTVNVSQGRPEETIRTVPVGQIVNIWTVKLGDTPMNLTLHANASDASLDLSGLPLQRLYVQGGASNAEIRFEMLNPDEMQSLTYKADASTVTFHGLANANFTEMTFEGRAGNYLFDFSGDLQRDATVNIKVGFSNVQILVPPGVSAEIFLEGRPGTISLNGAWLQGTDHFQNGQGSLKLTIMLQMTAGDLKLANE